MTLVINLIPKPSAFFAIAVQTLAVFLVYFQKLDQKLFFSIFNPTV